MFRSDGGDGYRVLRVDHARDEMGQGAGNYGLPEVLSTRRLVDALSMFKVAEASVS
jgi:hypothetical protein